MTIAQYASGRQQICPVTVSATSGGSISADTYYFWKQGRNDIGYNLPSIVSTVTVDGTQSIELTIPADSYRTGENWKQFVISANTINDNSSSTVIAVIDAVDPITQDPITLPKTLTLSLDSHLDLTRVGVASLPTGSDLVEGMVREYTSTGLLYRYDPDSTETPNGSTVIAATTGNWVQYVDDFNVSVVDTQNIVNGCDIPILDITDNSKVLPLKYALDGSQGQYRRLWLYNDNSTANIPKGERVGFVLTVNGQTASEDFEGLLKIVFEGLSDTTTGILDTLEDDLITPLEDIEVEKPYAFEASDLIIAKDVEPGEAWQCRVFPEFNSYQLRNLPSYLANIAAFPFIFPEAGTYNDASAIIGNAILPDPSTLRRAYPSTNLELFVDEGSGTVGGYFFNNKASTNVTNLIANTASQLLVINNNGEVYIGTSVQSFEDQRALVSTALGEGHTGGYSTAVTADASPNIDVTVEYPTTIRNDFSDVIAGSNKGTFNAEEVILFIRKNSTEIRKFTGFVTTNTTSDTFQAVWASGTVVANVNTNLFGLWTPNTPTTVVASTTGTDSYEVAVSFNYLGNSVTNIDHSVTAGSIQELTSNILDLLENNRFWQTPRSTEALLASIPSADLLAYETRLTYESEDELVFWTWVPTSTDNTPNSSIRPDDIALANPGRWLLSGGGGSTDVVFGTENPTTTPTKANQLFVNEVDNFTYVSKDVTGPSDWKPITFQPERIVVFGGEVVTHQGEVIYTSEPGTPYTGPVDALGFSVQENSTQVADNTKTLNFVNATSVNESGGVVTIDIAAAGSAITVEDEGTSLTTAATKINFVGTGVTATEAATNEIDVTIPGTSFAIEDNGTPVTQRANINFIGAGVTVADNDPDTDITISGYTDEEAQDAVGTILDNATIGDVDFTYDDGTPLISAKARVTSRAAGNLETIAATKTLAVDDPYYQVLDGGVADRNVDLYAGGAIFRHHIIINNGSTNSLEVRDNTLTLLSSLAPGEQAMVLWDTSSWRLL